MFIYLLAFFYFCDVLAIGATFLYQSQNVCNSIYNNKQVAERLWTADPHWAHLVRNISY